MAIKIFSSFPVHVFQFYASHWKVKASRDVEKYIEDFIQQSFIKLWLCSRLDANCCI